jgi:DNA polymerase elongation subunit (family B)
MEIAPLNIYYNRGEQDKFDDDFLDIVFKDINTGKHYVHTVIHPKVGIYVVKPEFRTFSHIRNFIPKEECEVVSVYYKTRFMELGKILKISSQDARFSPYICGADVQIEHLYLMWFIHEYHTDKNIPLSLGFMDIETDIISIDTFPEPGEVPINCVTYIDTDKRDVYTFVLTKDDLPKISELDTDFFQVEETRKSFQGQVREIQEDLPGFILECHNLWDESHGNYEYHVEFFDAEVSLLKALFQTIHYCDNDYVGIWNIAFDMAQLIARLKMLGVDPASVIMDRRFLSSDPEIRLATANRDIYFKEDPNPIAHRRRHTSNTYTVATFVDQMVLYAGVRSGRGKLPTTKLSVISQNELKDDKLNYSEYADIRHLPYVNFRMFVQYNIKDVLLQASIEAKVHDFQDMYITIYGSGVLTQEVFMTTRVLANEIRMFAEYNMNPSFVVGSNKSKLYPNSINDFQRFISDNIAGETENYERNSFEEEDFFVEDEESDESDDMDNDGKDKKKDKFEGAFVFDVRHMPEEGTGVKILGMNNKYVHDYVIDFDVTSEYPTAMVINNISNETLIGKVYLKDPDAIQVPVYDGLDILPDEEAKLKQDPASFMLDTFTEGDWLNFGNIFLGLPTSQEILERIEKELLEHHG